MADRMITQKIEIEKPLPDTKAISLISPFVTLIFTIISFFSVYNSKYSDVFSSVFLPHVSITFAFPLSELKMVTYIGLGRDSWWQHTNSQLYKQIHSWIEQNNTKNDKWPKKKISRYIFNAHKMKMNLNCNMQCKGREYETDEVE